jgi:hypothetical protein
MLDFTGVTLGSSEYYQVDTRYGYKTVVNQAGSSVIESLTSSSDLASFSISPAPLVTGGTNVISVAGSAVGTASYMTITYYNRYISI